MSSAGARSPAAAMIAPATRSKLRELYHDSGHIVTRVPVSFGREISKRLHCGCIHPLVERRVDIVVSYLNAAINVLNLANEAVGVFWTRPGNPGNRTMEIDLVTRSFDLT